MQSKLYYAITDRVVKPTILPIMQSCKSLANISEQQDVLRTSKLYRIQNTDNVDTDSQPYVNKLKKNM